MRHHHRTIAAVTLAAILAAVALAGPATAAPKPKPGDQITVVTDVLLPYNGSLTFIDPCPVGTIAVAVTSAAFSQWSTDPANPKLYEGAPATAYIAPDNSGTYPVVYLAKPASSGTNDYRVWTTCEYVKAKPAK